MRPDEGAAAHEEAAQLLPWHVNGSLPAAEAARVEGHLADCVACRAEAAYLRELAALVQSPEALPLSPARGFAALARRLGLPEAGAGGGRRRQRWLPALALAQAAALIALLALMVGDRASAPPVYRTLTDDATTVAVPDGGFRVLFRDGASEQQIRELLAGLELTIVDGPSRMGLYTLRLRDPAADPRRILAALRASPAVRFAERVAPSRSR